MNGTSSSAVGERAGLRLVERDDVADDAPVGVEVLPGGDAGAVDGDQAWP